MSQKPGVVLSLKRGPHGLWLAGIDVRQDSLGNGATYRAAVMGSWWHSLTHAISQAAKGTEHIALQSLSKLKTPITAAAVAVATVYGGPLAGAAAAKLVGPLIDAAASLDPQKKAHAQALVSQVTTIAQSNPQVAAVLQTAKDAVAKHAIAIAQAPRLTPQEESQIEIDEPGQGAPPSAADQAAANAQLEGAIMGCVVPKALILTQGLANAARRDPDAVAAVARKVRNKSLKKLAGGLADLGRGGGHGGGRGGRWGGGGGYWGWPVTLVDPVDLYDDLRAAAYPGASYAPIVQQLRSSLAYARGYPLVASPPIDPRMESSLEWQRRLARANS